MNRSHYFFLLFFLPFFGGSSFAEGGGSQMKNRYADYVLYETDELIDWLVTNRPERDLKQWHIHHTWDPHYADFNWDQPNHAALQNEMYLLHVDQNGWDDIGQHFTLFPDGKWMFGRTLEWNPASIRGWNRGAVAVEMVGNFDLGHDTMTPLQQAALLAMTQFMTRDWGLEMHFHRDHPDVTKTCPGSSIDRDLFLQVLKSGNGTFQTTNDPLAVDK